MFMSLMRKTQRTAKEFIPGKGALRLLSVMAMLLFATTPIAHSAVPETEVKAAFLFNFAKFVTWPAQAFSSETASRARVAEQVRQSPLECSYRLIT